jgi:hypothetical protein
MTEISDLEKSSLHLISELSLDQSTIHSLEQKST